jgi:hypothetical protein
LLTGYQFSLGAVAGIRVGNVALNQSANAVVLGSSSVANVYGGLFESKNGSAGLVCGVPTINGSFGRDSDGTYKDLTAFHAVRGSDPTYAAAPFTMATLGNSSRAGVFTNWSRMGSTLATYMTGVEVGRAPYDQQINLGIDLNATNTLGTQITAGLFGLAAQRATTMLQRNNALEAGRPGEKSVVYLNHSQGTGDTVANGSGINFAGQFESCVQNRAVIRTQGAAGQSVSDSNVNVISSSVRLGTDLSGYYFPATAAGTQYSPTNITGRAIWVIRGESVFDPGCPVIVNNAVVTFTGGHLGLYSKTETVEPGDIVIDTPFVIQGDMNNTLTIVTKSTVSQQKSVIGVFVQNSSGALPSMLVNSRTTTNEIEVDGKIITQEMPAIETLKPEYEELMNDNSVCTFNALGEGLINVCGENGNIEIGDYITTSSIPGKGMKQSDDLMRNYTVAKARENVTFSSPTEVKLIACTYHCG